MKARATRRKRLTLILLPSILALIVAAALSVSAQGNTYFVATNGNDASAGTIGAPWLTIQQAVARLHAGDTLNIRGGTYGGTLNRINSAVATVPSGTLANPITIEAYAPSGVTASNAAGPRAGAETVILQPPDDGIQAIQLTLGAPQYLIFQDFIVDMSLATGNANPDAIYLSSGTSHNTFLHLDVGFSTASAFTFSDQNAASSYQQVLYCKIHDNGARSNNVNNTGYGLYVNTSNNLYEGNDIYNNNGYGIHINPGAPGGNSNTIRKNRFWGNQPASATPAGGLGGTTSYAIAVMYGDSNLIYDNLIYSNAGGILVYVHSTNTLVYNNTIYNNTLLGPLASGGIDLQYYDSAARPIVRNNIVFGNATAITDYGDLNNAQTATIGSDNLLTDPGFANAGANDFHLTAASTTAIDQGATLTAVPDDFAGVLRPQGAGYDIGAFEYPAGNPPGVPRTLTIELIQ